MVTILSVFVTKLWLENRRIGEKKQNVGANDTKKKQPFLDYFCCRKNISGYRFSNVGYFLNNVRHCLKNIGYCFYDILWLKNTKAWG